MRLKVGTSLHLDGLYAHWAISPSEVVSLVDLLPTRVTGVGKDVVNEAKYSPSFSGRSLLCSLLADDVAKYGGPGGPKFSFGASRRDRWGNMRMPTIV